MNHYHFEGRIAAAPEMTNHGGKKVTRVRVIRNEYAGTDQTSGDRRDDRQVAINFVAFDGSAEAIAEHCFKGDQLIITATIQNNDYIPNGGTEQDKVYGYSFIIRDWSFGAPGADKRKWLSENRSQGQNQGYQDSQYR